MRDSAPCIVLCVRVDWQAASASASVSAMGEPLSNIHTVWTAVPCCSSAWLGSAFSLCLCLACWLAWLAAVRLPLSVGIRCSLCVACWVARDLPCFARGLILASRLTRSSCCVCQSDGAAAAATAAATCAASSSSSASAAAPAASEIEVRAPLLSSRQLSYPALRTHCLRCA